MEAVIDCGSKQVRVALGARVRIEHVDAPVGAELTFEPLAVFDGDSVALAPEDLAAASVRAHVVGEERGPKIRGFTYKPKTRSRRSWGHRQRYTTVEVSAIEALSWRRDDE